jgi:hypothetical protein
MDQEAQFIPVQRTADFEMEVVDFVVNVQPLQSTVLTGCVQRFRITFTPIGNFDSPLYLSVSNVPLNAVAQFSASLVSVSDEVELTIETDEVVPGVYSLQIQAIPGI